MCMYLEDIMLSEISQTEKDKYSVITYMWNLKKRTKTNVYNKTETRMVVTRDWEMGEQRRCSPGV